MHKKKFFLQRALAKKKKNWILFHHWPLHIAEAKVFFFGFFMIKVSDLRKYSPLNLRTMAESLGIESASLKGEEILIEILKKRFEQREEILCVGVLEILADQFGFLRYSEVNYLLGIADVYVSPELIRNNYLKTGDVVEGIILPPSRDEERYFSLKNITTINFDEPNKTFRRIPFENLTPLFPQRKPNLELAVAPGTETNGDLGKPLKKKNSDWVNNARLTLRAIELVVPLGLGQRALIVAPPRTGKTVILQNLAQAIHENHPDVVLMVMLIDERPEEATEMA